jgi:alanine-synthesizing transaminase
MSGAGLFRNRRFPVPVWGSQRHADGQNSLLIAAPTWCASLPKGRLPMQPVSKSAKLANVCYDIRGPVLARARQMEEEGHKIIKLNIGNLAAFGFDSPEEIQQDMIRNLPNAAGYVDSKGIFSARKAVMHYTQQKHIKGVGIEDIYIGNGVSELIVMAMNALLDNGDEVLVPAPDYPLWTAAVSLSGGTPRHYLCDEVPAGCPIWRTSAPRSRRRPGPSSSSIRTIRPAPCIPTRC